MPIHTHAYKTRSSSPSVGGYICNTNANTPTVFFRLVACPRLLGMGGVISLYKPTTTLQPKVLGFVRCTLSHSLFPKAMDNQPEKYSTRLDHQVLVWGTIYATPMPIHTHTYKTRSTSPGVGDYICNTYSHLQDLMYAACFSFYSVCIGIGVTYIVQT